MGICDTIFKYHEEHITILMINMIKNPENHKINVHSGIHTLPGYMKYEHPPTSIKNYNDIVKTVGSNLRNEKTVGVGRFTYGTALEPIEDKRYVADNLCKEFGLQLVHARYHTDGTFYNLLDGFPGVLFDLYGYLIINHVADIEDIGISDKINHKKWLDTNKKLSKLKKNRDEIEKLLLINKNTITFQVEKFREYQLKKLNEINIEISKIEKEYKLTYF